MRAAARVRREQALSGASAEWCFPRFARLRPTNYFSDMGMLSSVLRSWKSRFGAYLVGVGFATRRRAFERAFRVAAEHFAACSNVVPKELEFEFTGSTLISYVSVAIEAACRLRLHPSSSRCSLEKHPDEAPARARAAATN